jgi:MFS family permease
MLRFLGFFLHEVAFGFLSVFFPLYVMLIGGSLIDLGVISMSALLSAIIFSFLWGYLCDRLKRYKWAILLSFSSIAIILYVFTFTRSIALLTLLYVLLSIFHVAHEAPKNIIISETYEHEEWIQAFAFYEGFTEIGWFIGLLLGFLTPIYNFDLKTMMLICSLLHLSAFISSILFVEDPPLLIERGLVKIEKTVNFACKGITILSKSLYGIQVDGRIRRENIHGFCIGLILFMLATSILFTPLPIFFSRNLSMSTDRVFMVFALNSLGGVVGYFMAWIASQWLIEKSRIGEIAALRGVLTLSLILAAESSSNNIAIITLILILMGFMYAVFYAYTLSTSMELVSEGEAGLFNTLVGVGNAIGSFIGPYIAQTLGFTQVFLVVGVVFLISAIILKLST